MTEVLESVAGDRALLETLSLEERARLLKAAADVFDPDVRARRRYTKKKRKRARDADISADESMLAGHRHPRPAREARLHDAERLRAEGTSSRTIGEDDVRETIEEQHCYVCKQPYRELHFFYDQLCPPCAAFNFAKRSETADLEGRVARADGRAGEDRLPGRDQAPARRARV